LAGRYCISSSDLWFSAVALLFLLVGLRFPGLLEFNWHGMAQFFFPSFFLVYCCYTTGVMKLVDKTAIL
jgi:hypothetical protein